jgi:hypothetical protein
MHVVMACCASLEPAFQALHFLVELDRQIVQVVAMPSHCSQFLLWASGSSEHVNIASWSWWLPEHLQRRPFQRMACDLPLLGHQA